MQLGAMLNAYPDSIGKSLQETVEFLSQDELKNVFCSFYILPTVFDTDIDRGFSIISYDLNKTVASNNDLQKLKELGIDLTFDFILNHLSILSPQFQDILKNGDKSSYRNFFIDWNRFWKDRGEMTDEGYIKPYPDQFNYNNLRKNGLPLLMVRLPEGKDVPYWNTFYQKVIYPHLTNLDLIKLTNLQYDEASLLADSINKQIDSGKTPKDIELDVNNKESIISYLENNRQYLGQMDLNPESKDVWKWYEDTIKLLASYGASIVRLDSFSRLHKVPARVNFMNEPETWDILLKLREMAKKQGIDVLPEIHASYTKQYYKKLSSLGCMTYDYFLPGLILDALETGESEYLYKWANEIVSNKINVINMLGCHDGIPMRDVRGLLSKERVDALIEKLVSRGGHKKIIHGEKDEIYQVDMTYFSALGCNEKKMELARAIQMFMPGKPQIWYIDLFAEKNDEEILIKEPGTDTREVNRHSYTLSEANSFLKRDIVKKQLELLKIRNTHPAFSKDANVSIKQPTKNSLIIEWKTLDSKASLNIDLKECIYSIDLN